MSPFAQRLAGMCLATAIIASDCQPLIAAPKPAFANRVPKEAPLRFLGARILSARPLPGMVADPQHLRLVVSDDGKMLAYWVDAGHPQVGSMHDLYVSAVDGSGARRLEVPFMYPWPLGFRGNHRYLLTWGDWSPPYQAQPGEANDWWAEQTKSKVRTESGIWRLDLQNGPRLDNRSIQRVSPWNIEASSWDASPNGKRVAYVTQTRSRVSSKRDGTYDSTEDFVYVCDANGLHARRVGPGYAPRWSPSGKRLMYCRQVSDPVGSRGYTGDASVPAIWICDYAGRYPQCMLRTEKLVPKRLPNEYPAEPEGAVWVDDSSYLVVVDWRYEVGKSIEWYDVSGKWLGHQIGVSMVTASANGRWLIIRQEDPGALWLVNVR